ncbi:YciI family protein [Arvimicrobium flavum]|uniref:YciI family protein n=1 Tax=Arvimicrobium flavum TaxID=3393320 RepID=UPI00237A9B6F|nr:YciI family protein [Mesorhizobium shangrilense]
MQYILLIHGDETPFATATPDMTTKMSASYAAYSQALVEAGAMVSGERLKPSSTATVVRVRNDRTEVLDGPFADTKEQLGGFYIIEAPDLDAALGWAARCPGASHGAIEVRPVWPMQG